MATSFSSTFFFATLVLYLSFNCSSSSHLSSSPTIASAQINFWSKNVQNQMPNPILKKLSPLSQKETDFFTNMIISKNDKISAESTFCTRAKLACKSIIDAGCNVYIINRPLYNLKNPLASEITKAKADPFSFFRISVLKKGNFVHLPNLQQSLPDRAFLPPQIASKISLNSINDIANFFPQSIVGPTKQTIETTISYCNADAIRGEMKSCAKSLEEMITFSKLALGGKNLISLSSIGTKGSNTTLMIKSIEKFKNDKIVACHEVFLPFATYFCHSVSSSSLYAVDFVDPKTGALVNRLLAACHMDTSPWPANHMAFKILKFGPGQGEVCHWFSQIDLAWIAADA